MTKEKTYKKYLLIRECLGTEPYVNSRMEMDIKDVIEYAVIPSEEIEDHDVVKVVQQSDNLQELIDSMSEYKETEYHMGF